MSRAVMIVAALVAGTLITRFLPFLIFPDSEKTPAAVRCLGETLPYAVMGMLVVYCLKDINIRSFPFFLPELLAILVIVILHHIKRNSLLSIAAGTICYMLLIQKVF